MEVRGRRQVGVGSVNWRDLDKGLGHLTPIIVTKSPDDNRRKSKENES